jgi:hypothetical protein
MFASFWTLFVEWLPWELLTLYLSAFTAPVKRSCVTNREKVSVESLVVRRPARGLNRCHSAAKPDKASFAAVMLARDRLRSSTTKTTVLTAWRPLGTSGPGPTLAEGLEASTEAAAGACSKKAAFGDFLSDPIDLQDEVLSAKVPNGPALFVGDGGIHLDQVYADLDHQRRRLARKWGTLSGSCRKSRERDARHNRDGKDARPCLHAHWACAMGPTGARSFTS